MYYLSLRYDVTLSINLMHERILFRKTAHVHQFDLGMISLQTLGCGKWRVASWKGRVPKATEDALRLTFHLSHAQDPRAFLSASLHQSAEAQVWMGLRLHLMGSVYTQ